MTNHRIGMRVQSKTGRRGCIRFIGDIKGGTSKFCYVEWDDDLGFIYPTQPQAIDYVGSKIWEEKEAEEEDKSPHPSGPVQPQPVPAQPSGGQPVNEEEIPESGSQVKEPDEPPGIKIRPSDYKIPEYTYNPKGKDARINGDIIKEVEDLEKQVKDCEKIYHSIKDWYECNYKHPDPSEQKMFYINRIKNILKDNLTKRKLGNQRSGDLHFKKLWKINLSDRLFQRKGIISDKQYNVALLLDCSGSMNGQRIIRATQCAELFVKDFQKFCNISILLFHDNVRTVKKFNKGKYDDKMIKTMGKSIIYENMTYGGGTNEHLALRQAIDSFKGLPGRNIIVTMCDGGPNTPSEVHKEIERARIKNIIPIGLGIETSSVQAFYGLWARVNDAKDIYPAMTGVLSKAMRRLAIA